MRKMQPAMPSQPPPPRSRMSLASVVKGPQEAPIRVLLFGVEGIGKSTFAAGAPSPIFICAEDGTAQLDIERFPTPKTWPEILEAVQVLTDEKHAYRTLVIDTLDWVEPLLWSHISVRDGKQNIEDYGYGKGYQAALEEWRLLLGALEHLRAKQDMNIVLVAHSSIRQFKNPSGDDFDRFEMKLHSKAAGLFKEWVDAVLFADYETFAQKDKTTKRVKGVDTGARLIHTQRRAAFDAKNRYNLPDALPLSWMDFYAAVNAHKTAEPADLKTEIERKAKELGGEFPKTIAESLKKAGDDATKLAQLNNWLNSKLMLKGEE